MKRIGLIGIVMAMAAAMSAQEIVVDGIRFYGDYMGHATIAAFQDRDLSGDLVIPAEVTYENETLVVNKFEQYAFAECTKLRSVFIPSSIDETLYDCGYEFYGCTSLEAVTLSPNMQMLRGTFMGCKALRKIEIPEGVKYMDYVFENCSALEEVVLPEGLIEIGFECFYGCTSLRTVTLPSTVTNIGRDAFAQCRGLAEVTCLADVPPSCLAKVGRYVVSVNPFSNIAANAVLRVNGAVLESYRNTYPWKSFYRIESIEETGIVPLPFRDGRNEERWNLHGQRMPSGGGLLIQEGRKYIVR